MSNCVGVNILMKTISILDIWFQDWDGKGKYNKSTFYSMYKSQYYTTYYTFLSMLSSYYKSWNDAVIKYKVFTMV